MKDYDLLLLLDADDRGPGDDDGEPEPDLDDDAEVLDMLRREFDLLMTDAE